MYKVFSNILLQRMIRTLVFHQPRERAGIRAGYSTIYHLQVVNQLQKKVNEYNIPLCFAFVDYEKAFDSIEFEPLFEWLKNQSIDDAYLKILRKLYSEATSVLRRHKDSEKNQALKQESSKEITSLPNCLRHACNTPSTIRSTWKTKVSGFTVNTYPRKMWKACREEFLLRGRETP